MAHSFPGKNGGMAASYVYFIRARGFGKQASFSRASQDIGNFQITPAAAVDAQWDINISYNR